MMEDCEPDGSLNLPEVWRSFLSTFSEERDGQGFEYSKEMESKKSLRLDDKKALMTESIDLLSLDQRVEVRSLISSFV